MANLNDNEAMCSRGLFFLQTKAEPTTTMFNQSKLRILTLQSISETGHRHFAAGWGFEPVMLCFTFPHLCLCKLTTNKCKTSAPTLYSCKWVLLPCGSGPARSMPWSRTTISSSYSSQSIPQQWVFKYIIFVIKAGGGGRELEAFNKNIHPTGTWGTWAFKLSWRNFTVNPQNSVDPAVNKSWLKTVFIPLQIWCYIQNRWPKFYLAFWVLIFENSR